MTTTGFYMIRDRDIKQASNGSLYANFTLQQQHHLLSARLWDITEEQQEKFVLKSVIKVEGTLETYRSKQQLTIQKIRLATEEDQINRTELISKKGLSREDLWHELRMMMDEVESPILQQLIKKVYGDRGIREKITTMPASKKYHHAYYAGLLEQIVELMYAAMQVLPLYRQVNKDIVLALCLLGDIGKIKALTDPLTPSYTKTGELIGQLVLTVEMINQAAVSQGIDPNQDELQALKHGVLAQYPSAEGGQIQPKTAEALLYYYIKKMNTELKVLEQMGEQEDVFPYIDLFKRNMVVYSKRQEGDKE